MSHPQAVKINKSRTRINRNYIYKRCHHLSHMGIFNLQNIFNHILQEVAIIESSREAVYSMRKLGAIEIEDI